MEDIRRFGRENTVSAERQVDDLIIVSDGSPKVLFVGNSITLHGVKPDIGWHWLWGMAASAKEKDYVHQTMRMVREIAPVAGYMIAQASWWELGFWKHEEMLEQVRAAREYEADIVVIRLGDNTREEMLAGRDYEEAFCRMAQYFNPTGRAKLIITSQFWPHPEKDACIKAAAERLGAAYVDISDLGTKNEMKAIGLFEHSGVAAHPGDLGMMKIAEAIFEKMEPMLKGE